MLKRMRGYSKALSVTLWLVIFAFVGTTFLVWGFRSTSGPGGVGPIAVVEGEKIPYTEYQQAYQRQYRQYQEKLGDKFDEKILDQLNLKGQVMEGLVGRYLLLHEARRLDIVISPDELIAEITTVPAFSDATGFSRDRYLRALQSARLTPEKFEEGLREDLLLRKVQEWVKGEVHLLPDEVWEAFRLNRASVKAEYLLFSDPKAQQAIIQKVSGLVKDKKPWEEIVRASGLKPLISDFFSSDRNLPQIPDQERFKEAALTMERGAISPVIQGTKASYLLRVIDRKDPSPAEFEREKAQFSLRLLERKRAQVFADWIRQVRARAKVKIETANL
ncbi:MAG: SurA N-terminal domain-containing protein [candidate division NC10 bacterium]|nr:SurA N-terminal domain-containing protein [candidate division NC10 bacterium]MDE2320848.1 SurA N-terminal domain-containing protein [candidate division NC10 bacterium]